MFAEAAGGISALKAALDIAQGLNAALTKAEALEMKTALLERISQASLREAEMSQALNLAKQENDALRAQIAKVEEWDAKAKEYRLQEVGDHSAFAYFPMYEKADPKGGQAYCPHCFSEQKLSLMQIESQGNYSVLKCHSCKLELHISGRRGAHSTTRMLGRG